MEGVLTLDKYIWPWQSQVMITSPWALLYVWFGDYLVYCNMAKEMQIDHGNLMVYLFF